MKLYQITEQYQNLQALLLDPEFAENEDVLNALDNIQDDFERKVEQTLFVMKNIEAEIDPIDAEIKRLQAMKKTRQNAIELIKNRLKVNMKALEKDKLQCGLFSLSYRESKESAVVIDDVLFNANNLDETLINVKIEPNKTAIKNALKAGAEIIGARLVDSQVLTIR